MGSSNLLLVVIVADAMLCDRVAAYHDDRALVLHGVSAVTGEMWPGSYRCAVCLTVDVDLEYAWSKDAQMFESTWRGRALMAY